MSTLNDTDLLLVNRGGTDYSATFSDVKTGITGGLITRGLTAPTAPTRGQVWIDTTSDPPVVKVWDDTPAPGAWGAVGGGGGGGVVASATAPTAPTNGMLWVDTSGPQPVLKIWDAAKPGWMYSQTYTPVPPDINTVVLADVAGGSRYTSTAFPVTFNMTEDGQPHSTKGVKVKLSGSIQKETVVGTYTSNTVTTLNLTAGRTNQSSDWYGGASHTVEYADFNPSYGNTPYITDFSPVMDGNTATYIEFKDTVNSNVLSIYAFSQPIAETGKVEVLLESVTGSKNIVGLFYRRASDGAWFGFPGENPPYPKQWKTIGNVTGGLDGIGFKKYWIGGDNTWRVYAIRVNGVILSPSTTTWHTTITPVTAAVTAMGIGAVVYGRTSGAHGVVMRKTATVLDIVPNTGSPTFQAGEELYIKGAVPGVTMYGVVSSNGNVASLTSTAPATYQALSGTGPYTINFPATFPSGSAPDDDLGTDVSITIEAEARNAAGTDTATSTPITPA